MLNNMIAKKSVKIQKNVPIKTDTQAISIIDRNDIILNWIFALCFGL
jgi:hypothetical protein